MRHKKCWCGYDTLGNSYTCDWCREQENAMSEAMITIYRKRELRVEASLLRRIKALDADLAEDVRRKTGWRE